MSNKQKTMKRDIAQHSKAIRQKYLLLQKGEIRDKQEIEKILNPVTGPINKLIDAQKNTKLQPQNTESEEVQLEMEVIPESTPPRHYRTMLETTYGTAAAPYIQKLTAIKPRNLDTTYGLKWIPSMQIFTIGNTPAHIRNDRIIIGNKQYTGRPGLYELLTKQNPNKRLYNSYDLSTYKEILQKTSAHKVDYDENSNLLIENSPKFKNVIRKLFVDEQTTSESEKEFSGHGMWKNLVRNSKTDYKYWDDPNELIQRLRLLMASTQAGNTAHNNEIQEIIQELREKKYVK